MSRKTTTVLLALAVLSALIAGYLLLRPSHNESEQYRDAVAVFGHERVTMFTSHSAYAVFIGSQLSDPELAVSVEAPLVRWTPMQSFSDGDISMVVSGYGRLDGVRCFVKVQRIRPAAAVRIVGAEHLTAEQATGLADGTLEAIKIGVLCDPQDTL